MPSMVKRWAKEYNVGDRYIMKSNLGNLDTLKLIEKTVEYSTCNRFELGPDQFEQLNYTFISSRLDREKFGAAGIRFDSGFSDFGDNKMVIRAFDMYWVTNDIEKDKLVKTQRLKVDGIKDSINTYFFDKGNYFGKHYEVYLQSFNWSEKYGLVKYTVKESNEIFEFFKLI